MQPHQVSWADVLSSTQSKAEPRFRWMPIHLAHCISSVWLHRSVCLSTCSLSPHTHCKPGTAAQSPVTSTIRDSWRMTHNAVQTCLQCGRLPFSFSFFCPHPPGFLTPPCPHPLSLQTSCNYTQAGLMYTHSPQANADTWQIKRF